MSLPERNLLRMSRDLSEASRVMIDSWRMVETREAWWVCLLGSRCGGRWSFLMSPSDPGSKQRRRRGSKRQFRQNLHKLETVQPKTKQIRDSSAKNYTDYKFWTVRPKITQIKDSSVKTKQIVPFFQM